MCRIGAAGSTTLKRLVDQLRADRGAAELRAGLTSDLERFERHAAKYEADLEAARAGLERTHQALETTRRQLDALNAAVGS